MSKHIFPGYKKCMEMMNKRDPQICEDGFHFLRHHASEYTQELINDYRSNAYPIIPRLSHINSHANILTIIFPHRIFLI